MLFTLIRISIAHRCNFEQVSGTVTIIKHRDMLDNSWNDSSYTIMKIIDHRLIFCVIQYSMEDKWLPLRIPFVQQNSESMLWCQCHLSVNTPAHQTFWSRSFPFNFTFIWREKNCSLYISRQWIHKTMIIVIINFLKVVIFRILNELKLTDNYFD